MQLALNGFGYDGITVVSRGELRPGIQFDQVEDLDASQYWHFGQAHVEGVKGSLRAWWGPRRWKKSTYPTKVRVNPATIAYDGWETWELLNRVVTLLPRAPIFQVDTRMDLVASFEEVVAALYFKGRNRVKTDERYPRWLVVGDPYGIQLVIYDKSAHLGLPPNTVIRVEIRQRFETVTTRGKHRPVVQPFMAGEYIDSNPLKDVLMIDPARLPAEIRQRAERVGLNKALQDEGIDPAVRDACRRHILRHGDATLFALYQQEARRWHDAFTRGWAQRVQDLA